MLPAVTNWPPKRFTPSIWGLESRPFRELPTPFLCAMALDLDLGDAHSGHRLSMPAVPPGVLPPLELHDQDLVLLALRDHLSQHLGGGQCLRLHRHLPFVVHEQDLGELDRRALVLGEPLDLDDLTGSDPVLLAARRDDCFHCHNLSIRGSIRGPWCRPDRSPMPEHAIRTPGRNVTRAHQTTGPSRKSRR